MTNEQFKSLRRGDVIRGLCSGTAFVVDAHYGDFVIAMKSMHVSNPSEWELCASENSGAVDNSTQQLKAEILPAVVEAIGDLNNFNSMNAIACLQQIAAKLSAV